MNIYAWTAPPVAPVEIGGYTSKGCYADAQTRVLSGFSYVDAKMTIAKCIETCKTRKLSLAGVEK